MLKTIFCSHFSGQWRSGSQKAACNPKCSVQYPCPRGYFCSRITGDPDEFGKCIKVETCPRSPIFSNGILNPDMPGILGSMATFECPQDKAFVMINPNGIYTNADGIQISSVNIKCTKYGWRLSDGSNGEVPICIRSKHNIVSSSVVINIILNLGTL